MSRTETRKSSTGLAGMTNLNLLAPIKPEMVPCFEPISYRERLHKVLDGLQAARRNVRESELMPPVFGDAVGQFGIIHSFRYSVVPPMLGAAVDDQPADGVWHLSLNVTFDGGWEPYMRVIYRDIGTLLDLLLCHTVGYERADQSAYEDYCKWVRDHEVEGGLFYTDSSATLADQAYLAKLESMQRDGIGRDLELAQLALPTVAQRKAQALAKVMSGLDAALALPLRTLKGLHRLSVYFEGAEYDILKHFACSILIGSRGVMAKLDSLDSPPLAWLGVKKLMVDELALIKPFVDPDRPKPAPMAIPHTALQSHMFAQHEGVTHGCVVLLRVDQQAQALAYLSSLATACRAPIQGNSIGQLVAFTHAGLQALGVHKKRLAALPQEFVDGMEARCGLLGDVRGNHPDHWPRPLLYGLEKQGHRVDMKTVHVLVQLRLSDKERMESDLHPQLLPFIDAFRANHTGLRVLAVQATRSYRSAAAGAGGAAGVVGHFGFVDGISQPVINEPPTAVAPVPPVAPVAPGDRVSAGELLLGYANDRGDKAPEALDTMLHNGSFLVVRKLRQRVDNLHADLQKIGADERELALARMMGRPKNGAPPVALKADSAGANDFDFKGDNAQTNTCPLHSHIRRANPRDSRPYTPRILRRGMSYGPQSTVDLETERGVMFIAYCASLAEQFEAIQRWLAGGNNTGVSSAQADPFLRVPQAGEDHTFRYVLGSGSNASVQRVQFSDKPLVQLEWGMYGFVPSADVLAILPEMQTEPTPAGTSPKTATQPEDPELEALRQKLDDKVLAKALWEGVRAGSAKGPTATSHGSLIGTCAGVMAALKDRGATQYSVQGFGERMKASVGLNHLGMDHHEAGYAIGRHVNAAIEAITEEQAFAAATLAVKAVLAELPPLPSVNDKLPTRRSLDLVDFSDKVLAALCGQWVGLPDPADPLNDTFLKVGGRRPGDSDEPPRCPGNFSSASRYIFSPYPRAGVVSDGKAQGKKALGDSSLEKAAQDGVLGWLNRNSSWGSLTISIYHRLRDAGHKLPNEELAPILAGVLLGFPPTVQGNFIRTMENWVESEQLWPLQQDLLLAAPHAAATHKQARDALLGELMATMRKRPVPEMLWRSPMNDVNADLDDKHRVVLGITSALLDPTAPDELIFGRDDRDPKDPTAHGCPGMNMAKGVLLAMLAGLMQAGSLRPTGSPVLLILTPRQGQG